MTGAVIPAGDRRSARAPSPRPMGKVIGRQPTHIQIAPSKPYPWYGLIEGGDFSGVAVTGGQRFTTQQQDAIKRRGFTGSAVEAMVVRRNASHTEIWWNTLSLPPVFEFECPVVHRRADGRVRVIAPSGEEKLVEGDGWTTPRKARRFTGSAIR